MVTARKAIWSAFAVGAALFAAATVLAFSGVSYHGTRCGTAFTSSTAPLQADLAAASHSSQQTSDAVIQCAARQRDRRAATVVVAVPAIALLIVGISLAASRSQPA
jgi:hypothetical protein